MEYEGLVFNVVPREDLISSKRAAGRPVDLEDIRLLELGRADGGRGDLPCGDP